jgi:nucleotide-binding universal stress UspA family protein
MFDNVLVGVDGRPFGRDAMALACRLKAPEARLTFAFVHGGSLAEDLEDSSKLLEQERIAADVQADLVGVLASSPGRGLHEQVEKQDADLLVVGSCSRSSFGRAMLGDDTRAALNGAACAVAIASRGFAQRSEPIARIGVAYNGSPESETALAVARQLATRTGATLHALEVVSLPSVAYAGIAAPAIGETIDALLEEASTRMQQLSGVEGRAAFGLTGEELAAFSGEVDLLVVGSRGYGPAKRLVLGSTSNYLERHARCSLLVLPRLASPGEDAADSQRSA